MRLFNTSVATDLYHKMGSRGAHGVRLSLGGAVWKRCSWNKRAEGWMLPGWDLHSCGKSEMCGRGALRWPLVLRPEMSVSAFVNHSGNVFLKSIRKPKRQVK